jgi:hypothetical protein
MRKELRCPYDGKRLLDASTDFDFKPLMNGSTEGYITIEPFCQRCKEKGRNPRVVFGYKKNEN